MENMKSFILTVVTLTLVAVLLVYVFVTGTLKPGAVSAIASGTTESADSVEVYGQGKVYVDPDVAYINLGYLNRDIDPQKAQEDNAAQIGKIIAAIKGSGISDSDIQTSQYYVNTDYYDDNKSVKDFVVTNTVRVKVQPVENTGKIIKAGYDSGANLFYGVTFDLIKRQDSYLQALDMAMQRAQEKAKKLAADSGRNVGAVMSVNESQVSSSPYYYSSSSNFVASESPSYTGGGGAVSSGQLEIMAVVTVTYKLN